MTLAKRSWIRVAILVGLAFVVLGVALTIARRRKAEKAEDAAALSDSDRNARVPIATDDPTWGAQMAPVTLVLGP